jgi:hypothetical protein
MAGIASVIINQSSEYFGLLNEFKEKRRAMVFERTGFPRRLTRLRAPFYLQALHAIFFALGNASLAT